jgi:hypothetical protein
MPGVMHSVGILKDNELTEDFKKKTIERLKKAAKEGFAAASPFPYAAGSEIPPSDTFPDDIEDETKYPDFHKNVWKLYTDVARSYDVEGNFSLPPPVIDPFALVAKVKGPDSDDLKNLKFDITKLPSLNPAELAMMLSMTPVQFAAKIPGLIKPPPPLENPLTAGLNLPVPVLDTSINLPLGSGFSDKFEVDMWALKAPGAFLDVVTGLLNPSAILKLAAPNPSPCFAIDPVVKSKMFGPANDGDKDKKIIQQAVATFSGQCAVIAATANVIGDGGPKGLTGFQAGNQGFGLVDADPEPVPEEDMSRVRQVWLDSLNKIMGPLNEAILDDPSQGEFRGKYGPYSGYQSISKPGVGGETLCPGYKPGPAPKGPGGGAVTSCGLLPSAVMEVFIKDATATGDFILADPKQKAKFACGPQGTFALSKFLRAYVPASSGHLPKPGDVYFVCEHTNDVKHIGVIYSVREDGDSVKMITADAGQGPSSDQAHAWVAKSYNKSTYQLLGPNGEGADGNSGKPVRKIKGWMDIDVAMGNLYSTKYKDAWKLQFQNNIQKNFWESDYVMSENENFVASSHDKLEQVTA